MAHAKKHTKASCGHMFAHYDRTAENISNENIDPERTPLNYNLATHQQMNQTDFLRKRCSEVYCHNRKDVNVMCSWVVTCPQELPEEHQREFFERTYKFLEDRYGKENVISAYVHMDEVTPHMHFAFVPVVYDKKKDRYKVSAKVAVSRTDLQSFHTDLQAEMDAFCEEHDNEFECNILNGATGNGNQTIEELKAEHLKFANEIEMDFLEQVQDKVRECTDAVYKAQEELQELEAKKSTLESEIEALKDDKADLQLEVLTLEDTRNTSELGMFKRFLNEHPKIKEMFEGWCRVMRNRTKERMEELRQNIERQRNDDFPFQREKNPFGNEITSPKFNERE